MKWDVNLDKKVSKIQLLLEAVGEQNEKLRTFVGIKERLCTQKEKWQ